jgi:hypothetical protein
MAGGLSFIRFLQIRIAHCDGDQIQTIDRVLLKAKSG